MNIGNDLSIWGGAVCCSEDEIVNEAVQLYSDESKWQKAQQHGFTILKTLFDEDSNSAKLIQTLEETVRHVHELRKVNFFGETLWYF